MASEVERAALIYPGINLVKAVARNNPITGQHVELHVQPVEGILIDQSEFMCHLKKYLQPHQIPKRIRIADVAVGHRFKKS